MTGGSALRFNGYSKNISMRNFYRKSYRTLKLFIVHIKLRSYINCDIGTIFIILKSILIIYYYYSGIYILKFSICI